MKFTFCALLIISTLCFGQNNNAEIENFEFPIYPTCKKHKGNNEELKSCFQKQLWYDINFLVDEKSLNYYEKNTDKKPTIVFFTIAANGELKDFSFTKESNEAFATDILRRVLKTWKYYNKKNKPFISAKSNGKPIDFKIEYPINLSFSETFAE